MGIDPVIWKKEVKIKQLVLLLIGSETGVRCFSQSKYVAIQNHSNLKITVDTKLKTAL